MKKGTNAADGIVSGLIFNGRGLVNDIGKKLGTSERWKRKIRMIGGKNLRKSKKDARTKLPASFFDPFKRPYIS